MPSKERYARDKAYYAAYHRSDSYKLKVKPDMKAKLRATGKCVRCHHKLIEGAHVGDKCVNCLDAAVMSTHLRRSFF